MLFQTFPRLRHRFQLKHINPLFNTTYTNKTRQDTRSHNTHRLTRAASTLPRILPFLARTCNIIPTSRLVSSPRILLHMALKWAIVSRRPHRRCRCSNTGPLFPEEPCPKAKDLRSTTCLNIVTSPNHNILNRSVAPCPCHPIRLHPSHVP